MVELYAEATVAVVPSLYEGFSLPAVEAMACGVPLVATTGGALPEVVGETASPGCWSHPATRAPWPPPSATVMDDPELAGPPGGQRPAAGARALHLAGLCGRHGRELPVDDRAAPRRPDGSCRFRADRPLRAAGRPARRPAARPRRRRGPPRLRGHAPGRRRHRPRRRCRLPIKDVAGHDGRHRRGGARPSAAAAGRGTVVVGDALRLPFPPRRSTGSSRPRCSSTSPTTAAPCRELARVLRPGGTMAVTVPRWWPELLTWALSDDYHITPGGHIRIYRRRRARRAARWRPASSPTPPTTPTPCTAPYWWLRAAVGVADEAHPWVRAYHRMLVWDITAHTPVTRVPEALLNPVLGKSLVRLPEEAGVTGPLTAGRGRRHRRRRSRRCSCPTA